MPHNYTVHVMPQTPRAELPLAPKIQVSGFMKTGDWIQYQHPQTQEFVMAQVFRLVCAFKANEATFSCVSAAIDAEPKHGYALVQIRTEDNKVIEQRYIELDHFDFQSDMIIVTQGQAYQVQQIQTVFSIEPRPKRGQVYIVVVRPTKMPQRASREDIITPIAITQPNLPAHAPVRAQAAAAGAIQNRPLPTPPPDLPVFYCFSHTISDLNKYAIPTPVYETIPDNVENVAPPLFVSRPPPNTISPVAVSTEEAKQLSSPKMSRLARTKTRLHQLWRKIPSLRNKGKAKYKRFD